MTKRLVDIDDESLEDVCRVLNTTTLKDTVNESLKETLRTARRRQITTEDIRRAGELMADLGNPEIMAKAWE